MVGIISRLKVYAIKNETIYNFLKFSQFPPMKLIRYILRKKYMKGPLKETAAIPKDFVLGVETTNFCTTSCIFCPHSKMKREKTMMTDAVFNRCIEECVKNNIKELAISFFGEPLTDKKLFERIKKAKENDGIKVSFSTNAMLLNKENAVKIVESGVDEITISLDSCSEKTYKYIRSNGNFKQTVKNIENLVKIRSEKKSKKPRITVGLMYMQETKGEVDEFIRYWSDKVEDVTIRRLHHWGEEEERNQKKLLKHALPCQMLWTTLMILSNGDITVCCMDYEGVLKIGNILKDSIKDIWNSEDLKKLRRLHIENKRSEVKFCATCDIEKATIVNWWYYK